MAEASKLSRRLSTRDASFLYNETPNGPLHIGLLQTFEGEIEFDSLVEHFARRIHLLPLKSCVASAFEEVKGVAQRVVPAEEDWDKRPNEH